MGRGTWIYEITTPSGQGGGGAIPEAPPVTFGIPEAEVFFRTNHRVEVDVNWVPSPSATPQNFTGVAVYIEDPDVSSAVNSPLDGSTPLDGTRQQSGQWTPVFVNDSYSSPAIVFPDNTMGGQSGASYRMQRTVRIYCAAYGPNSQPVLVRAGNPNATPSILVEIPLGQNQGESGQEYTGLVTNAAVQVVTDYNRPDPSYTLTFSYTPPDSSIPLPPGQNAFGGVRIIYVYYDSTGNPIWPGTDSGIDVPVSQSAAGYSSPVYTASAGGGKFRVYFLSEDDSWPTGMHINSLVDGITPYVDVTVAPVSPAPDVTSFTIDGLAESSGKIDWEWDGSMYAQATFAWTLPAADSGGIRYAGVILYLVNVTGAVSPLTAFPKPLTSQMSNVEASYLLSIGSIPANLEHWTIAAISVDINGKLADDPANLTHSPTVIWDIAPPGPGGPGQEYAPLATVDPGATFTATQSQSTDGVGMVSFHLGPWTNPSDNQFGGLQVAMVVNGDVTKPTYWSVPGGATEFDTPLMPAFGNWNSQVPLDFYLVSDDPQGNKNSISPATPLIGTNMPGGGPHFQPKEGAVIPARSGWFSSEFSWPTDVNGQPTGPFQALQFTAGKIFVGSQLVVGGGPANSFAGQQSGQIAVYNGSNVLRAWIGESQPIGSAGGQTPPATPVFGGWFAELYVGGTSPLNAPVWIDQNGIVQIGGIDQYNNSHAGTNTTYPYISIRDASGNEKGRIGAKLTYASPSDPKNAVGSNPPGITEGAWFTQLAVGGTTLSNWNMLVVPDPNNALGSQFQLRNINLFLIDYAAHLTGTLPYNKEYQLKLGNSVWSAGSGATQWQFPGLQLYQVDGGSSLFGATLLSRGLVLRGTQTQNYQVLVSLVTYNGDQTGDDASNEYFWGELTMYSPKSTTATVHLSAGSGSGGSVNGNPFFSMYDQNANLLFGADQSGNVSVKGLLQNPAGGAINAVAYSVSGYGQVIGNDGSWTGKPISGGGSGAGQTPWASDIHAALYSLLNAKEAHIASLWLGGDATGAGTPLIDSTGAFVSPTGISVQAGIGCQHLQVGGPGYTAGDGVISAAGTINTTANIYCGGATPPGYPNPNPATGWMACKQLWVQGSMWCANMTISGAFSAANLVTGTQTSPPVAPAPQTGWLLADQAQIVGTCFAGGFQAANTVVINNRIGINTNAPNYPLSFGANLGDLLALYDAPSNFYGFGIASGQAYLKVQNAQVMTWTNSGNVGVGTSAPANLFTIIPATNPGSASAATHLTIGETSNNAGYRLALGYFYDNVAWRGVIQSLAGGADATLLLQPYGGQVGIGNTAPAVALHVTGGTHFGNAVQPTASQWATSLGDSSTDFTPGSGNWNYTLLVNGAPPSIGFHRGGESVGSIRYNGHIFTIGADDGWGVANVVMPGGVFAGSYYVQAGSKQVIDANGNWVGGALVSAVYGTPNQVIVNANSGAVTFSLPQNFHTGASVQLGFLTINQANDNSGYYLQVSGGIEMASTGPSYNILSRSSANNAIYANAGGITATTGFWIGSRQVADTNYNWMGGLQTGTGVVAATQIGIYGVAWIINSAGTVTSPAGQSSFYKLYVSYSAQTAADPAIVTPGVVSCYAGWSTGGGWLTASAAYLKQEIRSVTDQEIAAAFRGLQPKHYQRVASGEREYGLVVDDMALIPELHPAIHFEGGQPKGYSINQVLAIAIARLKQMEQEIAELKGLIKRSN